MGGSGDLCRSCSRNSADLHFYFPQLAGGGAGGHAGGGDAAGELCGGGDSGGNLASAGAFVHAGIDCCLSGIAETVSAHVRAKKRRSVARRRNSLGLGRSAPYWLV
jgi:hypothetical protein